MTYRPITHSLQLMLPLALVALLILPLDARATRKGPPDARASRQLIDFRRPSAGRRARSTRHQHRMSNPSIAEQVWRHQHGGAERMASGNRQSRTAQQNRRSQRSSSVTGRPRSHAFSLAPSARPAWIQNARQSASRARPSTTSTMQRRMSAPAANRAPARNNAAVDAARRRMSAP